MIYKAWNTDLYTHTMREMFKYPVYILHQSHTVKRESGLHWIQTYLSTSRVIILGKLSVIMSTNSGYINVHASYY